jgi:hypothetical protein
MTRTNDIIAMARQLWCALRGHGGIRQLDFYKWQCKQCGKVFDL